MSSLGAIVSLAQASGDVLMILDADMTVPPEDLPRFYEALVSGKGEFINGVRLVYPMEKEAMQTLNQINQVYTPQEAKKMVTGDFIQNMVSNITSDLLVKNTLQRLEAYAKGEVEPEAAPEAEKAAPKKRSPRAKKTAAAAKPEGAETPEPVETVAEPKAKPKRAKKTE